MSSGDASASAAYEGDAKPLHGHRPHGRNEQAKASKETTLAGGDRGGMGPAGAVDRGEWGSPGRPSPSKCGSSVQTPWEISSDSEGEGRRQGRGGPWDEEDEEDEGYEEGYEEGGRGRGDEGATRGSGVKDAVGFAAALEPTSPAKLSLVAMGAPAAMGSFSPAMGSPPSPAEATLLLKSEGSSPQGFADLSPAKASVGEVGALLASGSSREACQLNAGVWVDSDEYSLHVQLETSTPNTPAKEFDMSEAHDLRTLTSRLVPDSSTHVATTLALERPKNPFVAEYGKSGSWKCWTCAVCGRGDDENVLLLCSKCDAGFHIYCLDPPLPAVPAGAFYCPECKEKYRCRECKLQCASASGLANHLRVCPKRSIYEPLSRSSSDTSGTYESDGGRRSCGRCSFVCADHLSMLQHRNDCTKRSLAPARKVQRKLNNTFKRRKRGPDWTPSSGWGRGGRKGFMPKEEEEEESTSCDSAFKDHKCYVCNGCDKHKDKEMLICDGCEDVGCHLGCHDPVLISVPAGKWYCSDTCRTRYAPVSSQPEVLSRPVRQIELRPLPDAAAVELFLGIQRRPEELPENLRAHLGMKPRGRSKRRRKGYGHSMGGKVNKDLKIARPSASKEEREAQMRSIAEALNAQGLLHAQDLTYSLGPERWDNNPAFEDIDYGEMQKLNAKDLQTLMEFKELLREGYFPPLRVDKEGVKGYVAYADAPIPDRTILAEYVGEVDWLRNHENYDPEADSAPEYDDSMMTLLDHVDAEKSLIISSCKVGNVARFIAGINNANPKHKERINTKALRYNIDGEVRCLIISIKAIKKGDPICYDYNSGIRKGETLTFPTHNFV